MLDEHYSAFLQQLKDSVRQAQVRAGLAVNKELVTLYWKIGSEILNQQKLRGWGARVIDNLATDLKLSFPDIKGFSPRNLKYMRAFAEAYPDFKIVQDGPAQITWYHNTTLLDKVKEQEQRLWYVSETLKNGWSRDVLVHQIESGLFHRQGRAVTNFENTLPKDRSELAQQVLKDPYNFDFLNLSNEILERELEQTLLDNLRDFLLELGRGFSFVGSQYHLEVGDQDFYIDLLFYHLHLRCYIVVDLKISDFEPEFAGKMAFYLSAVDDQLRHSNDQPSIGLILCKTKNSIIAEYALRNSQNPIGVSEYRLSTPLPAELQKELPAIENLQNKLTESFYWNTSYYGVNHWPSNAESNTKAPLNESGEDAIETAILEPKGITCSMRISRPRRGPDFYIVQLVIEILNTEPQPVQHYHAVVALPQDIVNGTPAGELPRNGDDYRRFRRPTETQIAIRLEPGKKTEIARFDCVIRPTDLTLEAMQGPCRNFLIDIYRRGVAVDHLNGSFEEVGIYEAIDRAE